MQSVDQEPRHHISKLNTLNQRDLLMTEAENLGEEDRQYGSGKDIGNELIKMLKDNEEAKVRMR